MTDPLASSCCARALASLKPVIQLVFALATTLATTLAIALPGTASPVRSDARAPDPAVEIQRLVQAAGPAVALARLDALPQEQAREPRWRFLRGVLLAELGRAEEAVAVYTSLTQEFPELADPYNNLAVLRAAQGRLDEARAALETALQVDPTHREARENLGDVYVRLAARLWDELMATPGTRGPAPELVRKLRLAREIVTPAR